MLSGKREHLVSGAAASLKIAGMIFVVTAFLSHRADVSVVYLSINQSISQPINQSTNSIKFSQRIADYRQLYQYVTRKPRQ